MVGEHLTVRRLQLPDDSAGMLSAEPGWAVVMVTCMITSRKTIHRSFAPPVRRARASLIFGGT